MMAPALDFALPPKLERGVPRSQRDDVRLMVGSRAGLGIVDTTFARLPDFLSSGDVLVINTSATLPAAVDALAQSDEQSDEQVVVHFSSRLPNGTWTVEVRHPDGHASRRYPDFAGGPLKLAGGGAIRTLRRHPVATRLWVVQVDIPGDFLDYLQLYGRPIRYRHSGGDWPLEAYQTVYARELGSAEMPSAGRPITTKILTDLLAGSVAVLPIVLHAGVASLEEGEHPAEEYFEVPEATAVAANALRSAGGRLIAVGTTVVRALESVTNESGALHAATGYTELLIKSSSTVRAIDGLLTGWHEPKASHLDLVEAVAGRELMELMYHKAVEVGYEWHEFGDSCLILP